MLKKLLSVMFLFVMTVGVFSQSIPSGTARYQALGYNPFIMDAATDILRNPAWAGMYHNYAFGDIGTATSNGSDFYLDNQYAGINFHTGKNITLGVVLNKDLSMWNLFNDPNSSQRADSVGIKTPIIPLELLLSWSSKKLNVGLAPYYAMWSSDYTSTSTASGSDSYEDKRSSSSIGGTLGIISHMQNNNWVEGSVDFKLNHYKRVVTNSNPSSSTTWDNTGGMELGVNLRGWFTVSKPNKITVVPYINFSMFNWTPEFITSPTANTVIQTDVKNLSFGGGIGINMPILDDGMLAGGLSTGYTSYKSTSADTTRRDYTVTSFTLPQFNIGLEWYFTDWLIGRAGYSRSIQNYKVEDDAKISSQQTETYSESYPSNPDQTVTLGLGWSFGRFSLEGLIGEKFFQRAPYIVSGHATDMFGVLSASYNFNKK